MFLMLDVIDDPTTENSFPTLVTCPVMAFVTPAPTSMVPAFMIPKATASSGSLKDFNDNIKLDNDLFPTTIKEEKVEISLNKKKTAERIEAPFKVCCRRLLVVVASSSAVGVARSSSSL